VKGGKKVAGGGRGRGREGGDGYLLLTFPFTFLVTFAPPLSSPFFHLSPTFFPPFVYLFFTFSLGKGRILVHCLLPGKGGTNSPGQKVKQRWLGGKRSPEKVEKR